MSNPLTFSDKEMLETARQLGRQLQVELEVSELKLAASALALKKLLGMTGMFHSIACSGEEVSPVDEETFVEVITQAKAALVDGTAALDSIRSEDRKKIEQLTAALKMVANAICRCAGAGGHMTFCPVAIAQDALSGSTAALQAHDNLLIAERDREWLLTLADLGVAGHADSVRNGVISVVQDDGHDAQIAANARRETYQSAAMEANRRCCCAWEPESEPCPHSCRWCQFADELRRKADASGQTATPTIKTAPNADGERLYGKYPGKNIRLNKASDQTADKPRVGKCVSCGKETEWACSDCRIYLQKTVNVCESPDCRDKHEQTGQCTRKPDSTIRSKKTGGE